jgi:hypothetical protein
MHGQCISLIRDTWRIACASDLVLKVRRSDWYSGDESLNVARDRAVSTLLLGRYVHSLKARKMSGGTSLLCRKPGDEDTLVPTDFHEGEIGI